MAFESTVQRPRKLFPTTPVWKVAIRAKNSASRFLTIPPTLASKPSAAAPRGKNSKMINKLALWIRQPRPMSPLARRGTLLALTVGVFKRTGGAMEPMIASITPTRKAIAPKSLAPLTNSSAGLASASPQSSSATQTTTASILQMKRTAETSLARAPTSSARTGAASLRPGNATPKTIVATVLTKDPSVRTKLAPISSSPAPARAPASLSPGCAMETMIVTTTKTRKGVRPYPVQRCSSNAITRRSAYTRPTNVTAYLTATIHRTSAGVAPSGRATVTKCSSSAPRAESAFRRLGDVMAPKTARMGLTSRTTVGR